ncbi:hypothetical protein ACFS7Z_00970 [Pontibacter toksunensis]|uniref:Uncharacterized protein n=1 Tax=Pontibacter toksunensis TaxID=1332631 RepID=A0ABW6BNY3_9BACT
MEFKSYKEGELFCYLSITSPRSAQDVPGGVSAGRSTNEGGSEKRLALYLKLADHLSEGKNLWVIIRETPESIKHFGQLQPQRIGWKYQLIANDTEGMGVDKGFVPVQDSYSPLENEQGQAMLLFKLPDLAPLLEVSEDLLGDVTSHITVLALGGEAKNVVESLQSTEAPPEPESILGTSDLFINLTVAKEQGYYDTLLVKARQDIEELLSKHTS